MNTQLAIKESDLELVVSEKTLGSLTTNAIQIRDMVKSTLPMYDISNYNDDNIDQAKRDKAALNKAAKLLNSKRLEIEKEFMKPFGEFKDVVAETVKLIGECSAKIDTVVKQNEQQYKDKKLAVIRSYFDDGNTNLIDFRKIFKQEWLNKSTSMKAVQADIETVFAKVDEDLETLKGFGGDDFDVLFGPAYKGIPLGVVTAIAYSELYGKEIRYCSDRKEEKDHGADKGSFLGSKLQDGDRVVMIEDVTTSGKSMEETVPKVRGAADVTIVGLMVSLDRMEVGKGGVKCALDEVKDLYGFETNAIVTMKDVVEHLYNKPCNGEIVIDDKIKAAIDAYYEQYGAK